MPWVPATFATTGRHAIGTATVRLRGFADNRAGALHIRLWYPIDPAPRSRRSRLGHLLSALSRLRIFSASLKATPARSLGRLPLIAYVHDAGSSHEKNSYLLADLASHGFILAALAAPYGRSTVRIDVARMRETASTYAERGVATASMFLDTLHQLVKQGRTAWAQCVDLDNVGIMGSGLGGGVASAVTHVDKRYIAAANLGGPVSANIVTTPYLAMLSDPAAPRPPPSPRSAASTLDRALHFQRARYQAQLSHCHIIQIEGAHEDHFNGPTNGPVPANRSHGASVHSIIATYAAAFFTTYLKNYRHPLMCVRHSPYAEVQFLRGIPESRILPPTVTQ